MAEDLFWSIGQIPYIALTVLIILSAIFATIALVFFLTGHYFDEWSKKRIICYVVIFSIFIFSTIIGFVGLMSGFPDEEKETYVSEEHKLASAESLSGVLTYVSVSSVENVETIRFIRQAQDEQGTRYSIESRPASEVRIYQANDEAPVERHWRTRIFSTNPHTGEKHVFIDCLDYVEIRVPDGSVAHDDGINLNQ